MGENPALEKPLHFRPNVGWQPAAGRIGIDHLQERRHVTPHRLVQRPLLGTTTLVADRLRGRSAAGRRGHEPAVSNGRAVTRRGKA